MYKFQTSRGPDRDAEGIEGGREWGGGVPLPSRLGSLGSVVSSRSGVRSGALAENEFWRILELERTHLIDTNLSFLTFLGDLVGRIETPAGPDCGSRAVCWTLLH